MDRELIIRIEEKCGKYQASVEQSPDSHKATSEDPILAIRGSIAVSRGHIDDYLGYDRDAF